jgi:hypothetical protein
LEPWVNIKNMQTHIYFCITPPPPPPKVRSTGYFYFSSKQTFVGSSARFY